MKTIAILSLSVLLNLGCSDYDAFHWPYTPPVPNDDGLEVASLEEVGMDSQLVSRIMENIYDNKYDQIHSVLIYKDGYLVFEAYVEGNT